MNGTPLQHEDPLARPRLLARRWMYTGAAAVPLLAWALWPAPDRGLPKEAAPSPAAVTRSPVAQRPPLQLAAFDASIWTLDPPPPTLVAPPPPMRLQLVGMVRDGGPTGPLKAVIYDPDADELVVVAEGAKVGPRTITLIDAKGVTLTDAYGPRRLQMEQGVP